MMKSAFQQQARRRFPTGDQPDPTRSPLPLEEAHVEAAGLGLHALALDEKLLHLTFSAAAHHRAKRRLQALFPGVRPFPSHRFAAILLDRFVSYLEGESPFFYPHLDLLLEQGTPFHQKVWQLLRTIPPGETRTYGQLAAAIGKPGAARAVGGACRANPLVLIVPCHRVVASSGLGGFAGGTAVKKQLLAAERKTEPQR